MKTKLFSFRTLLMGAVIVTGMIISSCSKDDNVSLSNNGSRLKFVPTAADGFAAGTTGGAGGATISVTTAADFIKYATSSTAYIVKVTGTLNVGVVSIAANKTIIGYSTASTLIGNIKVGASNVIIQNLVISNPAALGTGDGIEVSGASKVFITKCTLRDNADGAIDIVRASDYVTVSWCRFEYPTQTVHNFCNLIGNGDLVYTDRGKLHVTMHHNWYTTGCNQRMPRVRFGQVHCYNNYFAAAGSSYCVGVGEESQVLLQNCYFENQSVAWSDAHTVTSGKIHWSGLYMVGTSTPTWASNATVFTPSYSYTLLAGSAVKAAVYGIAGNK